MYILYEVADRIATITLNRPDAANAQNAALLDELDAAWVRAGDDPDVSVIVLRAEGKHFSAGHDMTGGGGPVPDKITLDMIYTTESRRYLEYSMRWRNIPKPSIAAVQGRCIAGGLLLCWPCDLIIASEDAKFSDPVVMMGIGGVEYHGHTWNSGRGRPRRSCSPVGRSRPRRPSRPAWSTRWCRATSSTPRHVHSPSRSRRCRRSVYGRPSARSIRLSTSRLLRGHPVGVRCAPDRPRQCVERRRMAGAHETRRDEAEHQVAHTNAGASTNRGGARSVFGVRA